MPVALQDFWDVWYQPFLGALHVMGLAWFGGSLFVSAPRLRRIALVWMLLTGLVLYLLNPARIGASTSFQIKMALVGAITLLEFLGKQLGWLGVALWLAAIFLARGIAYV